MLTYNNRNAKKNVKFYKQLHFIKHIMDCKYNCKINIYSTRVNKKEWTKNNIQKVYNEKKSSSHQLANIHTFFILFYAKDRYFFRRVVKEEEKKFKTKFWSAGQKVCGAKMWNKLLLFGLAYVSPVVVSLIHPNYVHYHINTHILPETKYVLYWFVILSSLLRDKTLNLCILL